MKKSLQTIILAMTFGAMACPHDRDHIVKMVAWNGKSSSSVYLDKCIAPIVSALNSGGIPTLSSCCGHGSGWGYILLTNRVLIVTPETNLGGAWQWYQAYFEALAEHYGNPTWDDRMRRELATNTYRKR